MWFFKNLEKFLKKQVATLYKVLNSGKMQLIYFFQELDFTVPILQRNKVPEGFENGRLLDVSIRPDNVSLLGFVV